MPIQAVILAGGLGTRLRPFTITVPKPLLPLSDRPIVEVVLEQLRSYNLRHVCISLGYMAPLFQAFFGKGESLDMQIEYVVEKEPLGTAGALSLIENLSEHFVVMNGDTLTDLSFGDFLNDHVASNAGATIFSKRVNERIDYGVVEFDDTHGLTAYHEKPTHHYFVSTGIYALSRRVLRFSERGKKLDMPDLLKLASAKGELVRCHVEDGAYWRDIGRLDHYELASKDYQEDPMRFLRANVRRHVS